VKAQKARILRVFCCSLCVLCRLEAPKARVLRVFCGLEAKKHVFYECFVVWRRPGGPKVCLEEPGRSKGVLRERP
jgi:hypothetical protein